MSEQQPAVPSRVPQTPADPEAASPTEHLAGERLRTSAEVAAEAGVPVDRARRLWRALGFPDTGDAPAFTDADVEALTLVVETVADDAIDFETTVRLTRAVGSSMARLADWQVNTLTEQVEQTAPALPAPQAARLSSALRLVDQVGPAFEKLLVYVWRRHLSAAVGRIEALSDAEEDLRAADLTVGFADLVEFTALSNDIDDERLAHVVESFEASCADTVSGAGGRIIKTLGDSVLFVIDDPPAAVEVALRIVEAIGGDETLPDVRVGLASGSVIFRLGDVFGPPVNLASRLTGVARRNRVICDVATREAVRDHRGYETRALPPRSVRGFGVVEPMAVRRTWADQTAPERP
jgi:adenylate cyclase